MVKLLIVADDFTGALDTGVQFSKKDVPTLVTTNTDLEPASLSGDIEVMVVDIESRHLPAQSAYERVRLLTKAAVRVGVRYFYKKTDSTLRGNIGAELSAFLHACGGDMLAFVPAFPKSRRTTKNGIHYVDGVMLHETLSFLSL